MSDSHASHHDSHDGHSAHAAPTVPETVNDEAGNSPKWLPLLGLVPVAIALFYFFAAPHLGKLFTTGRPASTTEAPAAPAE
jgi:hypothetical protein